jgi:hypothetical protein
MELLKVHNFCDYIKTSKEEILWLLKFKMRRRYEKTISFISLDTLIMLMIRSLKTISFLIFFLIIIPAIALAGQYQVVRVVDGDTIVIRYNGKYEKVRLLCVDTPESVHPDKNKIFLWEKWHPDTLKRN